MKTAEENIKSITVSPANVYGMAETSMISGTLYVELVHIMKDYAKQVAEQALKYASENATVCSSEFDGSYVNTDSIINTPIKLP